jgi:transcriptional regulator with XRE-family HTH domain
VTTRDLRPIETLDIPLDKIGLNPRFQPRMAIDPDWVRHLAEETDPDAWDPIWVRRWSETDTSPRPPGCEHAVYEVASGFTRTTAAQRLARPTIRADLYDCPDDGDFLVLAAKGNARHGARLTNEEQIRQAKRLHDAGLGASEIARVLGLARQTVSNWLSGRNTNAARLARQMLSEQRNADAPVPAPLGEVLVSLSAQELASIAASMGRALNLGDLTATVSPAQAQAWWHAQSPPVRRAVAGRVQQIAGWWQSIAVVADALEREQEATNATHEV